MRLVQRTHAPSRVKTVILELGLCDPGQVAFLLCSEKSLQGGLEEGEFVLD
jgi:hypothetical protein